jgi:hypothetical protein
MLLAAVLAALAMVGLTVFAALTTVWPAVLYAVLSVLAAFDAADAP